MCVYDRHFWIRSSVPPTGSYLVLRTGVVHILQLMEYVLKVDQNPPDQTPIEPIERRTSESAVASKRMDVVDDESEDIVADESAVPLSFSTLPTPRSGANGIKRKDAVGASFLMESKEREARSVYVNIPWGWPWSNGNNNGLGIKKQSKQRYQRWIFRTTTGNHWTPGLSSVTRSCLNLWCANKPHITCFVDC